MVCDFDIDMVIDLSPPAALGPAADMTGETIMQVCAAIAGAVESQLSGRMGVARSVGFAAGEREREAVGEAVRRACERGDAEAHRFEVPPHEPSAAEAAPDATLLPPQADGDLRVLVCLLGASAEVGTGERGQALFRAAGELEEAARGFSDPHARVLRADALPASAGDAESMQRFVDSCVR